ncbi:hypothetical protein [Streptomyces sp. NBC_01187]|uniref:hypothetical protein n=1 Tax=Streptomyces sp. NBC_01187 TaxID=2903766 RepID=UPI0038697C60|nr:hypothetical protein OG220_42290 [Streptomyces sp. NBC_01187]
MKTSVSPAVLTTAFYAFYDLHRPVYHAYAAFHLTPEEAQVAVAHLFDLVASNWSTVVAKPCPAAWAWRRHTRAVAQRSGHPRTAADDAALLHEYLRLSIEKIAFVTGTERATVTALLATSRRRRSCERSRPSAALRNNAHPVGANPALAPLS